MKQEKLQSLEPISIIMVTYKRLHLLKRSVKKIYENVRFPHRLLVINNGKDDIETIRWLTFAKNCGYIYDFISLENKGLANGLTEGFKYFEKIKGGISEYVVTTQDDVLVPDLRPCILERLLHLFKKYESEYGAISCRTQRIRRRDVDENRDIIDSSPSLASFFRIQRSDDIQKFGNYFTKIPHWESPQIAISMKKIGKKLGVATHLYVDDSCFEISNKGFPVGFTDYLTYSKERVQQGALQPYPEIDEKTCIPLKINTPRDRSEQKKRDAYYDHWGREGKKKCKTQEQIALAEYAKEGKGVDLGCGMVKIHKNALGVDIYPHPCVDILGDCRDLWMFKNGELDFIVGAHILEHFPDFIGVLKKYKEKLKVGGILGMAVPDGEIKKKYILKQGHKNNIGLETLKLVFEHILKMEIIEARQVKKNNPNKFVALIVGKKR